MKIKQSNVRLGCARGLLVVAIACVSIILMQGISWFINGRERGLSFSIMQEARVNLHLGMSRQEAEQFLVDAWSHRQCDYPELSRDMYFFGSKDTELSAVLILRFEKHDDSETLIDIGTVENDMLRSGHYSECIAIPP